MAENTETEKKEPTHLRYSQLKAYIEEHGDLYLKNEAVTPNGARAIVVINYPSHEGNTSFNFPRTALPVPITDYIEPGSLMGSKSFRKLFNNGTLKFVPQSRAEKELDSDIARDSLERSITEADDNGLRQSRRGEAAKTRAAVQEQRLEASAEAASAARQALVALDPRLAALADQLYQEANKEASLEQVGNPRFNTLRSKVENRLIDDTEQIDQFVTLLGELTEETLFKVIKDHVWSDQVKMAAKERLKSFIDED